MGVEMQIEKLSLHYGAVQALKDISFNMEAGQVTALLGRNGVGKTSLARAITGRNAASGGQVILEGHDVTHAVSSERAERGLGYVPQGREIFPLLSVKENLETGYAILPRGVREIPETVYELFPILKDMTARRGGDLSGGQQQQLAIGRAMVLQPKVLVLDEPTEGIQPSIIKDIGRAIEFLKAEFGLSILLIEQYFEFAWELADQVIVLDRGQVVLQGQKGEVEKEDVRRLLTV